MLNFKMIEKIIAKDKAKAMEMLITYFRKHPDDYQMFKKKMSE